MTVYWAGVVVNVVRSSSDTDVHTLPALLLPQQLLLTCLPRPLTGVPFKMASTCGKGSIKCVCAEERGICCR